MNFCCERCRNLHGPGYKGMWVGDVNKQCICHTPENPAQEKCKCGQIWSQHDNNYCTVQHPGPETKKPPTEEAASGLLKTYTDSITYEYFPIEEWEKSFFERFGANKIWVTPSKDNVETVHEIWTFIHDLLNQEYQRGALNQAMIDVDRIKQAEKKSEKSEEWESWETEFHYKFALSHLKYDQQQEIVSFIRNLLKEREESWGRIVADIARKDERTRLKKLIEGVRGNLHGRPECERCWSAALDAVLSALEGEEI